MSDHNRNKGKSPIGIQVGVGPAPPNPKLGKPGAVHHGEFDTSYVSVHDVLGDLGPEEELLMEDAFPNGIPEGLTKNIPDDRPHIIGGDMVTTLEPGVGAAALVQGDGGTRAAADLNPLRQRFAVFLGITCGTDELYDILLHGFCDVNFVYFLSCLKHHSLLNDVYCLAFGFFL